MKDRYKFIELDGQKYRIEKMPARTALYIGSQLAMALVGGARSSQEKEQGVNSEAVQSALSSLSKETFFGILNDCLKTVNKITEVNGAQMPEPVLKADGSFVDPDMEYDISAVLRLTVDVLMFNVSNFFGGKGLSSLKTSLSRITK